MSSKTVPSPSSASIRPTSRMPGVSRISPPPGSRNSWRLLVVWRPRASAARMSWVAIRSSPSRAFARVDLPTPDVPISTQVSPGAMCAIRLSMPVRSRTDRTTTGQPGARAAISAATRSGWSHRSALVSTSTGLAPLCQAAARKRSSRRGLRSAFIEVTMKTTSILAAMTCSVCTLSAARRTKAVRRGRMAWMVAVPLAALGASATQSPATGWPASRASWRRRPETRALRVPASVITVWASRCWTMMRPGTWPARACGAKACCSASVQPYCSIKSGEPPRRLAS